MTKTFGNFTDLMDFSRSTSGTALRKVSYGSELVTNGTFDTDTTGWAATGGSNPTLSFSSGQAVITATQTGSATFEQTSTEFEQGKLYQIKINVVATTDNIDVWNKGTSSVSIKAVKQGENVINYVATQDGYLRFGALGPSFSSGEGFTFDNISVKEVTLDSGTDDPVVFNHPADTPRIEYAADGTVKGLLIEEARTNLLDYSNDFSTFSNAVQATVTDQNATGPDGQLSATTVVPSASSSEHYLQEDLTPTTGTFTDSVYIKPDGYDFAVIRPVHVGATEGATQQATFNLSDGTVASTTSGVTAIIENVGNGWYRCSASYTISGTITGSFSFRIQLYNTANGSVFAGDGTKGILIYGAQREAGSFPTSYIPTSGATATRSADLASIAVENFGYNKDEGTLVVEFDADSWAQNTNTAAFSRVWEFTGNAGSNADGIFRDPASGDGTYLRYRFNESDATTAALGAENLNSVTGVHKVAVALGQGDAAIVMDGGTPATGSGTAAMNIYADIHLGRSSLSTNFLNGHIRDFQYYPRRLTNRQLQELTGATNTYDYTTVEAGTITRTPVATGSDLVAYGGFNANNYLEQPYNPDLNFGTGDFCIMGWVKLPQDFSRHPWFITDKSVNSFGDNGYIGLKYSGNNLTRYEFLMSGGSLFYTTTDVGQFQLITMLRRSGTTEAYIDGKLVATGSNSSALGATNTDSVFMLGSGTFTKNGLAGPTGLALVRVSATAPTAEQIAKIYEDEKVLFQDGAQATLYGSSDAVTALAHDDTTNLLHVGTSAGRSVFQGLRRVENTTDAVGTAISASNGLVVEE